MEANIAFYAINNFYSVSVERAILNENGKQKFCRADMRRTSKSNWKVTLFLCKLVKLGP